MKQGFPFAHILLALRNRFWVFMSVALAILLYTAFVTYKTTPMYKAEAWVENPPSPMLVESETDRYDRMSYFVNRDKYYMNELIYIGSMDFCSRVYAKLPDDIRSRVAAGGDPVSYVAGSIRPEHLSDSYVLQLIAVDPHPAVCTAIANVAAKEYLSSIADRYRAEKGIISTELEGNTLPAIAERIREKKKERIDFLNKLGFTDLKEAQSAAFIKWKNIVAKIYEQEEFMFLCDTEKARLTSWLSGGRDYLLLSTLLSEELSEAKKVKELLKSRDDLLTERHYMRTKYLEKWPALVALNVRIVAVEELIVNAVVAYIRWLDKQILVTANKIKEMKSFQKSVEEEIKETNSKLIKLDTLNADITSLEQQYAYYVKIGSEAGVSAFFNKPAARILKTAVMPSRPYKPDIKTNFTFGFLIAIIAGAGLAVLVDMFSGIVRSPADLQESLASKVIGTIPLLKRAKAGKGPVIIGKDDGVEFEALRKLRTELNVHMSRTSHKVFSVLSTCPVEGKTTVAVNLAQILAADLKTVLLIDADLRKPSLHVIAGKEIGSLFNDYLSGPADRPCDVGTNLPCAFSSHISEKEGRNKTAVEPQDLVVQSVIDGVCVVSTTVPMEDSAEKLGREQFKNLIEYARNNFDVVIIDTPPIVSITDGEIVARMADASILVVRENVTKLSVLDIAKKQMDNLLINLAGVIINCATTQQPHYYYYSKYYLKKGKNKA